MIDLKEQQGSVHKEVNHMISTWDYIGLFPLGKCDSIPNIPAPHKEVLRAEGKVTEENCCMTSNITYGEILKKKRKEDS